MTIKELCDATGIPCNKEKNGNDTVGWTQPIRVSLLG